MDKTIGHSREQSLRRSGGSHSAAPAGQGILGYLKATLFSIGVGEVLTILLLLLFAFVNCSISLPAAMTDLLALAAGAIGALAAGYLNGRLVREKGLIFGGLCGGGMLLVLFLLNAVFHQESSLAFLLCKLAAILLCGGIGGILGVNRRARKVRL